MARKTRKKQLTEEERQAYAEQQQQRRDELEVRVKDLVATFKDSDTFKDYLIKMTEFKRNCATYLHPYSAHNILFAFAQDPNASIIGSFGAWRKMGRYVQKGEKSHISVWAPIMEAATRTKKDEQGNPILDAKGNPVKEVIRDENGNVKRQMSGRFTLKPVFDISQTDGEPLPKLASELKNPVEHFDDYFKALKTISPLPIYFSNEPAAAAVNLGQAKGVCSFSASMIVIKAGMAQEHTLKTAVHEITHATIHDPKRLMNARKQANTKDGQEPVGLSKNEIECQAEGTAYVVCEHLGFDTADYSIPYLFSWSQEDGMPAFTKSLDVILQTSDTLIDQIEEELGKTLTKEQALQTETAVQKAERQLFIEAPSMPLRLEYSEPSAPLPDEHTKQTLHALYTSAPAHTPEHTPGYVPVPAPVHTSEHASEPTANQASEPQINIRRVMADPVIQVLKEHGYQLHLEKLPVVQGTNPSLPGIVLEKDFQSHEVRIEVVLPLDSAKNEYAPDFSKNTTSLYAIDKTAAAINGKPPIFFEQHYTGTLPMQMQALQQSKQYQHLQALATERIPQFTQPEAQKDLKALKEQARLSAQEKNRNRALSTSKSTRDISLGR